MSYLEENLRRDIDRGSRDGRPHLCGINRDGESDYVTVMVGWMLHDVKLITTQLTHLYILSYQCEQVTEFNTTLTTVY